MSVILLKPRYLHFKEGCNGTAEDVYTVSACRFGIAENVQAAKVLIIRVAMGNDEKTFRYLPLKNGSNAINQISAGAPPATENRLMKLMAINDTVAITAEGYKEKKQAIVSYDQELDVTLEPESSSSDTGRSSGFGKALGAVNRSGTCSI